MTVNKILLGNCKDILKKITSGTVDLVYLDPPFFTQKKHSLVSRENEVYEFDDSWGKLEDYIDMIEESIIECKRVLKSTGSIFLHCDKTAAHHIRVLLDKVFGATNFQSEIVWSYKRWSNAKKGLLNSHQNIYFYSKNKTFKFNTIYTAYSATTNVDQILQDRKRAKNGKSIYKTNEKGEVVLGKPKKGVPLSDVWEIPYLNPKAKERVGYPTQKPVLLLQQVIKICTDENDLVLDPFCGSGTTCVAAKSLNRNYIGIDRSKKAIGLAKQRLKDMIITDSKLLKKGTKHYLEKTEEELALLKIVNAIPVQRNAGIDGFLKEYVDGKPVPVKIQKNSETLFDSIKKLEKASNDKGFTSKILIQTQPITADTLFSQKTDILIIKSPKLLLLSTKTDGSLLK